MFKSNTRKCNYAISFSGCVYRDKTKCLTALPTYAEQVKVFERKLIGGISGFKCSSCIRFSNIDGEK